jgi:hypothetical protein
MISAMASFLGVIVIASIVVSKYFQSPRIFFLTVILASIFYQMDSKKENDKIYNFENTMINVSIFIFYTGILGLLVVKMVSLFFPGFD